MKTHLNLSTSNLDYAVSFYSTLLDAKPVKVLADYALFVTDEPGMELALDLRDVVAPAGDLHFGICVESLDQVDRAINRLTAAGLAASYEREETCCYANQTKVWAIDPDGRRWEVYTVHEDTAERDGDAACSSDSLANACCS